MIYELVVRVDQQIHIKSYLKSNRVPSTLSKAIMQESSTKKVGLLRLIVVGEYQPEDGYR